MVSLVLANSPEPPADTRVPGRERVNPRTMVALVHNNICKLRSAPTGASSECTHATQSSTAYASRAEAGVLHRFCTSFSHAERYLHDSPAPEIAAVDAVYLLILTALYFVGSGAFRVIR
jgi:hypothetical protein